MSTPTPAPAPPPTPPGSRPQIEPNLLAFFAVLIPPVSSLAIGRMRDLPSLVRFYVVQGSVFGLAVLACLAAIYFLGRGIPDSNSDGKALAALGVACFNLVWMVAWVIQMVAALLHKRWQIPIISPITKRWLKDGRGPV